MNKAARSYFVVARTLRLDADVSENATLEAEIASDRVDWKQVFDLADAENMTVAMAMALRRRNIFKALPQPVQMAFSRREIMGAEINRRIRCQAEDAIQVLNAAGVAPMVLKGALHLFEAPPEELAARFMRDIDLIVPANRLKHSIAALRDVGYVPESEDRGWTYHYHPLHHKDHIVGVELHIRPGQQRHFLTGEEAWAEAVPVEVADLQLFALGPDHRVAHNMFHSEIQDHGFSLGEVCLRQLYDLARVCARFDDTIDWGGVLGRFERHGMGPLLRARMHLAVELLGAPKPPFTIDDLRSRLHLRRCLWQLHSKRLMNLTRWIAGVADRFGRFHLDLRYGCGTTGVDLQWCRVRHAASMLLRHRGTIMKRVAKHGRRLKRGR